MIPHHRKQSSSYNKHITLETNTDGNVLDNPEVEEQCKDTQKCKGEWEQMERTASRRVAAWRNVVVY